MTHLLFISVTSWVLLAEIKIVFLCFPVWFFTSFYVRRGKKGREKDKTELVGEHFPQLVYIACHLYKSLTSLILFHLIETFPYKCHPLCLYWKTSGSKWTLFLFMDFEKNKKKKREPKHKRSVVLVFPDSKYSQPRMSLHLQTTGPRSNEWGVAASTFCLLAAKTGRQE